MVVPNVANFLQIHLAIRAALQNCVKKNLTVIKRDRSSIHDCKCTERVYEVYVYELAERIGITINGVSVFCFLFQNLKLSINEMTLFELSRFCFTREGN